MALYSLYNGAMPTTADLTPVASNNAIRTMLQLKPGTGVKLKIVEWGWSGNASAAAQPGVVSLIETGTIFGTVTAAVAADIQKYSDPNALDPTTSLTVVGTTATGYTCTAEGSIVAGRTFDLQQIAPTSQYFKQFPLGREPIVNVSAALRIRNTFAAVVGVICYVVFGPEE